MSSATFLMDMGILNMFFDSSQCLHFVYKFVTEMFSKVWQKLV